MEIEKILLMSKASTYEIKNYIRDKNILKHFKSDYISNQLFQGNFFLIISIYIYIGSKEALNLLIDNTLLTAEEIVSRYAAVSILIIILYSIWVIRESTKKYEEAQYNMDNYINLLENINKLRGDFNE